MSFRSKRRIDGLEVRRVRWPLRRPFVTALGSKAFSDNVLARAWLSGGAEGWGEASSSLAMSWQTGPAMAAALRRLGDRFRGRDAGDLATIAASAWRSEPRMPTAAAAFECALTDALCRQEGVPFHRFFGGAAREIKTVMSISAVAPWEVAERVGAGRREGFDIFKLKLNGRDPAGEDLPRIRAARRAAPRAELLLDANQSYGPAGLSGLFVGLHREGISVELVEEPFRKGDWRTLGSFRGRSAVPLLLDETVQTPADARRARERRLAEGVNVKIAKSGLQRSLDIIRVFSSPLSRPSAPIFMIGCMAESKIGLAAAAQLAMGSGAFDYADLDSDLLLKPLDIPGGYVRRGPWLTIPNKPFSGLGVSWR